MILLSKAFLITCDEGIFNLNIIYACIIQLHDKSMTHKYDHSSFMCECELKKQKNKTKHQTIQK